MRRRGPGPRSTLTKPSSFTCRKAKPQVPWIMTDPVVVPKTTPKPITIKHLAYELAEQHQLTKKQSLEILEDLVGMAPTLRSQS